MPSCRAVFSIERTSVHVQVCVHKHAAEAMSAVKYSPDGRRLAAGSHDNIIYIYSTTDTYELLRRCSGHSSYLTHLDWSADGVVLQSNCGAYEVLYWDARTGRQACSSQRDARWAEWTCTLGFPVMGVWADASDGTDVNCLSRSFTSRDPVREVTPSAKDPLSKRSGRYVVTGDDRGSVCLYAYPCVAAQARCRTYRAHSAHVAGVRFSYDNRYVTTHIALDSRCLRPLCASHGGPVTDAGTLDLRARCRWVVSVGGRDRAVCQWAVEARAPGYHSVPAERMQLAVLAPPPKRTDAAEVIEYAAGARLSPVQDGPLEAPAQAVQPAPVLLSVSVVTSDLRCGAHTRLIPRLCGQT